MAPLLVITTGVILVLSCRPRPVPAPQSSAAGYSGSTGCRDCHETFYRLWSTSRHGLAMQPFIAALGREQLTPQKQDIAVRDRSYCTEIEWYDVSASGLRHFTDVTEQAVPRTEREFTFNTSCHGCHSSQLASNYDLASDTYRTTWAEPGINCETCHGPGVEHIQAMREIAPGTIPTEPRLIVTKQFTHEQKNDLCTPCHARMSPVTNEIRSGTRAFDAFDLIGLENRDFYPDGRDLGENYNFTAWRMSPCAKSGQLDCLRVPGGRRCVVGPRPSIGATGGRSPLASPFECKRTPTCRKRTSCWTS